MNTRTIVAAVAGGVVMFILGFVLYGLLLDTMMKESVIEYQGLMKTEPAMVPLALYNLVWGFLIAFIFDQWAEIKTFAGGLAGGAFIMFCISLATDLGFLAFMNIYKGLWFVAVDVVVVTFMGAITGGVIGLILGKMGGAPESA